jgi:hypothetical protein
MAQTASDTKDTRRAELVEEAWRILPISQESPADRISISGTSFLALVLFGNEKGCRHDI